MNEPEDKSSLDPKQSEAIFHALAASSAFRSFADDFGRITSLPISLTQAESWQLAHHGSPHASPFCAMLAGNSSSCASCLRIQQKLGATAAQATRTVECVHGLCETAVPMSIGKCLLGFIRTGQVFRHAPSTVGFQRVLKRLARWGVKLDTSKLREAYFATRVMKPAQYHSAVGLLDFLARHLAILNNQLFLQQLHAEDPKIARSKEYIESHYAEPVTLQQVAAAVNTSHFYFCKLFKQVTGITFTRYLSAVRVEKAKYLMLNPHFHVSEIAFAVGFGSLTQFNRVFKLQTSFSPTAYRAQLGLWQDENRAGGGSPRHGPQPAAALEKNDLQNQPSPPTADPNNRSCPRANNGPPQLPACNLENHGPWPSKLSTPEIVGPTPSACAPVPATAICIQTQHVSPPRL